jgi:phospholipid/cholesterol/gamma-HCH transport system permease protein
MQETAPNLQPGITVTGEGERFALKGVLDIHTLTVARGEVLLALKNDGSPALDISGIDQLDTPGALFLCELRSHGAQLTGTRAEHQRLLDLIVGLDLKQQPAPDMHPRWRQLIVQLGKSADATVRDAYDLIAFFGMAASAAWHALLHPGRMPLPSISRHVAETGINALFIVGVMGFMISIVIGYQGVAQLRPYGGEEFTINLVAVSVLREMGVLITSIMVAGRTGSAFTAELGVMKVREEIDALNVMGLIR